jgi:hypothetical protein
MSQGRLALQQQGVRGPESALMQQMQANTMQESLANRAEQVAMQQALSDREKRQSLASQRALISLEPSFKAGLKQDSLESDKIKSDRAKVIADKKAEKKKIEQSLQAKIVGTKPEWIREKKDGQMGGTRSERFLEEAARISKELKLRRGE